MAEATADLLSSLSLTQSDDPDALAARLAELDELANTKLAEGQIQEAQQLFKQLQQLRAPQLTQEARQIGSQQQAENQPPAGEHSTQQSQGRHNQQAEFKSPCSPSDEWESKDWDSALESLRPAVPVCRPVPKALQPPPLHRPKPTAADALALADQLRGPQTEREAPPSFRELEAQDDEDVVTTYSGGFNHCVELCGLTTEVRTGDLQELMDALLPDESLKPYIRWADDNHAVLVCASVNTAKALLEMAEKEGLVIRPFLEATQTSKQLPISELLPPKERPQTSAAVAKRLMSHALGLPGLRDRTGERDLAIARKQAREARKARQKEEEEIKEAAWGDSP